MSNMQHLRPKPQADEQLGHPASCKAAAPVPQSILPASPDASQAADGLPYVMLDGELCAKLFCSLSVGSMIV